MLVTLKLNSKAISSARYDTRTKELAIQFHDARTYRYLDVAPATIEAFAAADSKGRFINAYIKPHHALA